MSDDLKVEMVNDIFHLEQARDGQKERNDKKLVNASDDRDNDIKSTESYANVEGTYINSLTEIAYISLDQCIF